MRQTSIDAFNAIKESGLLSKRRWQVYEYLYQHGPCSGTRVSRKVPGGWKRLSELQERGLAKEVGQTRSKFTGHKVILWDVTGKTDARELPTRVSRADLLVLLGRVASKTHKARQWCKEGRHRDSRVLLRRLEITVQGVLDEECRRRTR